MTSLKYSSSVCRKTNNIEQLYLWTSPAAAVFTHREKKLHYCTSLAAFVFKKKTRKWLSILSFWFYVTSNFWAIFCKIRATSGNFFEILEQLVAKARLSETLYIRNQDRQTLSSITNFCWNLEQLRRDRHLKGPAEKLEVTRIQWYTFGYNQVFLCIFLENRMIRWRIVLYSMQHNPVAWSSYEF